MRANPRNWSDERLHDSIAEVGLILPIYRFGVQIVDGERRFRIAKLLRRAAPIVELRSEAAARQTLWELHPDRALERVGKNLTVTEYARELGVPIAQIATVLHSQRRKPLRAMGRQVQEWRGVESTLLQLWLPPSLRAFLATASARASASMSELTRLAIWNEIKRHIPQKELRQLYDSYRKLDRNGPNAQTVKRLIDALDE